MDGIKKHAYCIMAHDNPQLLVKLLQQLDDERNDVFVLIDKKSDIRQFEDARCERANLYWVPRVAVYWGDLSFAVAELTLLQCAMDKRTYAYLHLLSGVDLPLKSQDDVHRFFDEHSGTEFVDFSLDERNVRSASVRTRFYYFFVRGLKVKSGKLRRIFKILMEGLISLQRLIGVSRNADIRFYKGSNWVSITGDFADWLLKQADTVHRIFHHTLCCDEIFIQTMLMMSPFSGRISPLGNLRMIDWERGDPYTWRNEDVGELLSSPCFFARKFTSSQMDVVNAVCARAMGDSND